MLHHPGYREKFADNLKRELPRISFAPDFWAFAEAGKKLAALHLDYEQLEPWDLKFVEAPRVPLSYRVDDKMRLSKDKLGSSPATGRGSASSARRYSSQPQSVKALAAIAQADKSHPPGAISAARCRNAAGNRKRRHGRLIPGAFRCADLRWLRKTFEASARTGQRYMRVARHLPESRIDATRVSYRSRAAVLRAIRGVEPASAVRVA